MMDDYYNLTAIIYTIILMMCILTFVYYRFFSRDEISVYRALNQMKGNLIQLIVFYQSKYPATDQIVLIKKWMEAIRKDEIDKMQLELFKEFVNKYCKNEPPTD